ncbi:hypothetical protein C4553_03690 [Candidatus Parcubacteria bacterium]|nr:MAG: hypothetical protein C4553_03690 [Candidatus Parcubacteria bacterium]
MDKNILGLSVRRIIISVLALGGIAIMAYLTYIHFAETRSFCDISETVSCDVVTTSIYSEIFGIPVSLLGLGYFFLILFWVLKDKSEAVFQKMFVVTLLVLIPSLYLSSLELFVIKAFCILCESSKILMIGILIITGVSMPERPTARLIAPLIIGGLLLSAITYFAQTGTSTKADYSEFVQCLNQKGVVYYKSVKCSNCKRQEKLLGPAYLQLNSVECHPEGPGGNPQLCLDKNVNKTPTFILEPEGEETKRLEGLQQLNNLADFANCPL